MQPKNCTSHLAAISTRSELINRERAGREYGISNSCSDNCVAGDSNEMGVIKITQSEFKRRFLRDQENAKRLRLHRAGHTDSEIAISCGTYREVITDWRKSRNLAPNGVICARGYKEKVTNRKNVGRGI